MNSKLRSENTFQKCRYTFGGEPHVLVYTLGKKFSGSIVQACLEYINNGLSRRNVKFCAKIRKKFVNGILLIKYHIMGKQYSVQRTSCDIDKFQ